MSFTPSDAPIQVLHWEKKVNCWALNYSNITAPCYAIALFSFCGSGNILCKVRSVIELCYGVVKLSVSNYEIRTEFCCDRVLMSCVLFICAFLTTLSVAEATKRPVIGWLMKNKLGRII